MSNEENLKFLSLALAEDGSSRESLVDRLYQCLKREISEQRWAPGDLLPDANAIAATVNASRASVSRAYSRLADEGFLRRTRRKGSVLITSSPQPQEEKLLIGVILCTPDDSNLFRSQFWAQELASACVNQLKLDGHTTELAIIGANVMRETRGIPSNSLFSFQPHGVVAIGAAPALLDDRGECVPVIYLHRSAENLRPSVIVDAREGIRLLTIAAIEHGHRDIVLLGNPAAPTESGIRWLHHLECMTEKGLKADEETFQESMKFNHHHLGKWKNFLQALPRTTCFIAAHRVSSAQHLASAALLLGKHIPADFSLLSFGRCFFQGEKGNVEVFSADINIPSLIKLAASSLIAHIRDEYSEPVSYVLFPHLFKGESLGAVPVPRSASGAVPKIRPVNHASPVC